jgi:probable rRNA maturation factor
MTLAVHVNADGARSPVGRARAAALATAVLRAERVGDALISIAFVSDRAIAALNRRHLGHAGATDVLAFGFERAGAAVPVVGDIYIAPAFARENARRHGATWREEVSRLIVHGVLHVLGYDHPGGEGRSTSPMWRRQERLLARLLRAPAT